MKKILSVLCAVVMIASLACLSAFADDAKATITLSAQPVEVGATQLAVDINYDIADGITVVGATFNFEYNADVMGVNADLTGAKTNKPAGGFYTWSQYATENPYMLVWANLEGVEGAGSFGTLYFDLKEAAVEGAEYTVTLVIDAVVDVNDVDMTADTVGENASAVAAAATTAAPETTVAPATDAETTVAPATDAKTDAKTEAATTTVAPATTKAPDKATQTGDMMFVVVAVMVVALGAAVVVKKVNVK